MKILSLLSFVFLVTCLQAQTVLKIVAIDKTTHDDLPQVLVSFQAAGKEQSTGVYTNRKGEAILVVPVEDSVTLFCKHLAYGDVSRTIIPKGTLQDTLKLVFYLRFSKSTNLAEVTIKPPGVPDTIFHSQRVSVNDFEFLPDGRMVLLTYPKNMQKGTELLLYNGDEVVAEIPLKEKGEEIIRDYRGNPHVVTEKNVFGILARENHIEVTNLEKEYYKTYIAPIVDTTLTKYFFSNFNPDYPAFEYFTYDLVDSSYKKIAEVEDELMMELYRAEYKWVDVRVKLWAKQKENETGIDAEIWVGANYFTRSVYYKQLYAPLFERNDTVFIFDHYKNWMYRYTNVGELIDSLPIFYHLQAKQNGWKKQLLQDQTTGQVYIIYEKAGLYTLRRIDLVTGELKEVIPLHFKYPEKILIRSNSVYYTYRPFESPQKKFLYREKLPLTFPLADVQNGDKTVEKE